MLILYKYYTEIKNRIMLLLFAWAFFFLICYCFKESLLFIFIDSNKYYKNINDTPYFIFTNVDEIFYVYLRLVIFVTNQVVGFMLIYHCSMFLILGLYSSEYAKLKLVITVFISTWFFSVILFKMFVVPFSWSFFLSFQKTNSFLQPASFFFEARIFDYFNYFTNFYYICLINCQFLTFLILFLNKISEKAGTIKKFRKLFYLIFVIFSTIATPPDIISQVVMSLNLIIIYELLLFIKCLIKLIRQPIKTDKNTNSKHQIPDCKW